jgi:hypothetical protein
MAPSMLHYLEGYPSVEMGMSAIDVQVHIDSFGNTTLWNGMDYYPFLLHKPRKTISVYGF